MDNEIMEFPKGWEVTSLGDIAGYINGRAFKPTEWQDEGKPIIRIQNLNNHAARFNYSALEHEEKYIVKNGDLLFAWSASLGAYIWHGQDAWLNQHIFKVHPYDCIDKSFLYYLLVDVTAGLYAKSHGSGMVHVTKGKFESTEIIIPPLPEQHRIVAKIETLFSELDKGVESLKTAREQLKVYRQALLKHAFSGKLTEQWRAENPDKLETAEALLQRIQTEREQRYQQQLNDWETTGKQGTKPKAPKILPPITAEELAELPELPVGWTWTKSGELFEFVTSGSRGWAGYYSDSGSIFIRITNLNFNTLKLDLSPKKIQYVRPPDCAEGLRTRVKEGDFLFSITGYLGMFAIAPLLSDAYVNQHIALARPLNGFSKTFFGYYVTSHTGGIHYLNKQTKGAVKAGLNLDDIQNLPVPIASINEQTQISCELESRLSTLGQLDQTLIAALQQAETLHQSILKKAFSGQLVPQDPNDEPASELLKRIQAEKAAVLATVKPKAIKKARV